ncbi:MAG: hypothetical protein PHY91_02545 [Tissierellia bacterium]|nr:hypothetical protein [Tissierellia bacterium]MDD4725759.1 hypothetical protein [Tissierellia bacterium]
MRKNFNKFRSKYKNIIGIALGIIGFIILISVTPYRFILAIIGIILIIMGFLLIKIK